MAQSAVTIEFVALVADVTARTNGGIGSAATTGVTSTIAGSDGIDSSDSTQLSTGLHATLRAENRFHGQLAEARYVHAFLVVLTIRYCKQTLHAAITNSCCRSDRTCCRMRSLPGKGFAPDSLRVDVRQGASRTHCDLTLGNATWWLGNDA